jgi:hypothetical protein
LGFLSFFGVGVCVRVRNGLGPLYLDPNMFLVVGFEVMWIVSVIVPGMRKEVRKI